MGHGQIIQRLLEKGADVNAQAQGLRSRRFRSTDNAQGGKYGTALQAASASGHDRIVQRLLEEGADVNAQGGLHDTALRAAPANSHDQEKVESLISLEVHLIGIYLMGVSVYLVGVHLTRSAFSAGRACEYEDPEHSRNQLISTRFLEKLILDRRKWLGLKLAIYRVAQGDRLCWRNKRKWEA
jgi:hypothetical protein